MRYVVLLLVASGCGRVGYDVTAIDVDSDANTPSDADAALDASAASDADATTTGGCSEWGAFSAPVRLNELTGGPSNWLDSLSADERTIILSPFDSVTRNDLYWTARGTRTDMFDVPSVPIAELNQDGVDAGGHLSVDGLRIYFASDRPGTLGLPDLWVASRAVTSAPFSDVTHLGAINSSVLDSNPHLSSDELRIYFVSRRDGTRDLFVASRDAISSSFSSAVPLTELNSTDSERSLTLTSDELTVLFPSTRPGGLGGYDLWQASRPDRASAFGTPTNVSELNSPFDDVFPHLSQDGTRVYFNYDTLVAGGRSADVWAAERTCLSP